MHSNGRTLSRYESALYRLYIDGHEIWRSWTAPPGVSRSDVRHFVGGNMGA